MVLLSGEVGVRWRLQDRHAVLVDDPQLQFGFTPGGRGGTLKPRERLGEENKQFHVFLFHQLEL